MAYREDRSPSFFGEDSYQTILNTPSLFHPQTISCSFTTFLKRIVYFLSRKKRPDSQTLIQEPNSELLSLRTKYRSTLISSSICSKSANRSSQWKGNEESALRSYATDYPRNDLFILENIPFNIMAKYTEVKHKNMDSFILRKLKEIAKPHSLGLIFEIGGQTQAFCNKIMKEKLSVLNLDLSAYARRKLSSFYEFPKVQEFGFNPHFDTLKIDGNFQNQPNFEADFSLINWTCVKSKQSMERIHPKEKLKKLLIKMISQAIMMSQVVVLAINQEIQMSDLPEIFERALNDCLQFPCHSLEIIKTAHEEDYLVLYYPKNLSKATEEIDYLFSHINPQTSPPILESFQRVELQEIFLSNRIRLLKQIIINNNFRQEPQNNLIECILKILLEYQIINKGFVQVFFPTFGKLVKEVNSPLHRNRKFTKTIENTPIIEKSSNSIEYNEEEEKPGMIEIPDSLAIIQTVHHHDEGQKLEFSSYTSNNLAQEQSDRLTGISSHEELNVSLEARLEHLNVSLSKNRSTLNFKKYIMLSEKKDTLLIGLKRRRKQKKNLWKSSF